MGERLQHEPKLRLHGISSPYQLQRCTLYTCDNGPSLSSPFSTCTGRVMILRGFNTIEVSPIERGVILTYGLDGVGRAAAKNDGGPLPIRCRDTDSTMPGHPAPNGSGRLYASTACRGRPPLPLHFEAGDPASLVKWRGRPRSKNPMELFKQCTV